MSDPEQIFRGRRSRGDNNAAPIWATMRMHMAENVGLHFMHVLQPHYTRAGQQTDGTTPVDGALQCVTSCVCVCVCAARNFSSTVSTELTQPPTATLPAASSVSCEAATGTCDDCYGDLRESTTRQDVCERGELGRAKKTEGVTSHTLCSAQARTPLKMSFNPSACRNQNKGFGTR